MNKQTQTYAIKVTGIFVAIWVAIGLVASSILPDLGLTYLLSSLSISESYKIALCFFLTMVATHGLYAILQGIFKLKRYNFQFIFVSCIVLNVISFQVDLNSLNLENKVNQLVLLLVAGLGVVANFVDHFFYIRNKVRLFSEENK